MGLAAIGLCLHKLFKLSESNDINIYLFISVHKKVVKNIAQQTYEARSLLQNYQLGTALIVHSLHFTEEEH